jgi:hypothetical protein
VDDSSVLSLSDTKPMPHRWMESGRPHPEETGRLKLPALQATCNEPSHFHTLLCRFIPLPIHRWFDCCGLLQVGGEGRVEVGPLNHAYLLFPTVMNDSDSFESGPCDYIIVANDISDRALPRIIEYDLLVHCN